MKRIKCCIVCKWMKWATLKYAQRNANSIQLFYHYWMGSSFARLALLNEWQQQAIRNERKKHEK